MAFSSSFFFCGDAVLELDSSVDGGGGDEGFSGSSGCNVAVSDNAGAGSTLTSSLSGASMSIGIKHYTTCFNKSHGIEKKQCNLYIIININLVINSGK